MNTTSNITDLNIKLNELKLVDNESLKNLSKLKIINDFILYKYNNPRLPKKDIMKKINISCDTFNKYCKELGYNNLVGKGHTRKIKSEQKQHDKKKRNKYNGGDENDELVKHEKKKQANEELIKQRDNLLKER